MSNEYFVTWTQLYSDGYKKVRHWCFDKYEDAVRYKRFREDLLRKNVEAKIICGYKISIECNPTIQVV